MPTLMFMLDAVVLQTVKEEARYSCWKPFARQLSLQLASTLASATVIAATHCVSEATEAYTPHLISALWNMDASINEHVASRTSACRAGGNKAEGKGQALRITSQHLPKRPR